MSISEDEFLKELRKVFTIEAEEHLQTIVAGLIDIEKNKDPAGYKNIIEAIYRAAHSLKGASRSVNMMGIGIVCQSVESVFSAMKNGFLTLGFGDFDTLHRAVDGIARMLSSPSGEGGEAVDALTGPLDCIVSGIKKSKQQESSLPLADPILVEPIVGSTLSFVAEEPLRWSEFHSTEQLEQEQEVSNGEISATPATDIMAMVETIRVEATKLDSILLQAEELISIKLAGEQRISELEDILTLFGPWKKEWEKVGTRAQVSPERSHTDSQASFDWNYSRLLDAETKLKGLKKALHSDLRTNGMLVDRLLEGTKTVLMLPFSTLLRALPKMVRDISRQQNKEVDLVISGGEIKVDKRILERIKDPLVHLVRNCIDHGIEKTATRLANNKPAFGTILISISQVEGTKIEVQVTDDGSGIDLDRVLGSTVNRGLLSEEGANVLDKQSALQLIFESGVSSSNIITDISGRGLGMAIVKEAVDKLGGSIAIETRKEKGTTFRICLPLTLATFRGILIREYGHSFTLPTSSVERVIRIRKDEVRSVENREIVAVEGVPLSLVRLGAVLGLDPVADGLEVSDLMTIVILKSGQNRMAFVVDKLLNEQEILIKNLGKQLVRVRNIAGATVLGSGQVVLVLNVVDLMRSATRTAKTAPNVPLAAKAVTKRKVVLVVEDSITSRTLFKNILVSAGFDVHTVVDGMEAWIALKEKPFDIVISDVEMPRMNGFDLTAKIRSEAKLAELPVVLVTSLVSREDRERGVDVGADAYIAKSSFDQSNLLEVVRRLVG
ncbi:response regulator [Desulfosporosinus sp. Sb-LF]|uniref:hybrid sensor histidine kinase/response regulator n=1 Tax=Desulfosporosinus sp. Sb-LF TaxID=2560027 RepID=UPI00107F7126|nr:response regulator [Desulfosporosinus sp. Sb-LF]TGE32166.1 hybrid sensor histidine kinase/response regulator [Desulfosporosinus sp. Sb-LF]